MTTTEITLGHMLNLDLNEGRNPYFIHFQENIDAPGSYHVHCHNASYTFSTYQKVRLTQEMLDKTLVRVGKHHRTHNPLAVDPVLTLQRLRPDAKRAGRHDKNRRGQDWLTRPWQRLDRLHQGGDLGRTDALDLL